MSFGLDGDALAKVNEHAPANIAAVLAGEVDQLGTVAAALKLTDALAVVRSFKPVDPLLGKLIDALASTRLTAWERDLHVADRQIAVGRTLSDKQVGLGRQHPRRSAEACQRTRPDAPRGVRHEEQHWHHGRPVRRAQR